MKLQTSFCYHASGSGSSDANYGSFINRASLITDTAMKVTIAASLVLYIAGVIAVPVTFLICAGSLTSAIAFEIYRNKHFCETAGIILNEHHLKLPAICSQKFKTRAIATENSADSEIWRRRMIESAEHNVIISGNYCGGKAFKELLDTIEKRYKDKPELKVVIISSPKFLTSDVIQKLDKMKRDHAGHFSLVESPDIWHINPGIKKSTNHTKCTVVDFGKYFMLGGSGIKDNFTQPGLESSPKRVYLKEKLGDEEYLRAEALASTYRSEAETRTLIDRMVPGCFRDMDFVFKPTGNQHHGLRIFTQSLLLAYRWEQYTKQISAGFFEEMSNPIENVSQLGLLSGIRTAIKANDSVTVKLLKTPALKLHDTETTIPEFDEATKHQKTGLTRIIASGPEHSSSSYEKAVLEAIKGSKKRLVINHMYFQPTAKIFQALVDAANRGVKIKIVTCGVYENCPSSHHIFGPRNKKNCIDLIKAINASSRENVEIYFFEQKKIGNHKKVIVADNTVIAGSSNLGYKSLQTSSDHELNFINQSDTLAQETIAIINQDILHSKKLAPDSYLTFSELFQAYWHQLLSPLIG